MKLGKILQAVGLLIQLIALLWIVFAPNFKTEVDQPVTVGDSTIITSYRSLDMPLAFIVLAIGVVLVIIGLLIPYELKMSVAKVESQN
jgi:hypothetical protein